MRQVFLYHDEADKEIAIAFRKFLFPLEKNDDEDEVVKITDCNEFTGERIIDWLKTQMVNAEVVLLLVTPNLVGTPFFYDEFTPLVLEKRNKGGCVVLPVVYSPSGLDDTKFGKLGRTPSKGPIADYSIKDSGYKDVYDDLKEVLQNYEQNLLAQSIQFDTLKSALTTFNFYKQFSPKIPLPDSSEPFSVLVLQGGLHSGHNLLAWRWRKETSPAAPKPRIETIDLTPKSTMLESSAQIGQEAWKVFNEGIPYAGDESKLTEDLAKHLLNSLKNEAIVIRLDNCNPTLQQGTVDDFFAALKKALVETKTKEAKLPPLYPLWFHLFCYGEEMPVSLDFSAQISLPAISQVSKEDFDKWINENFQGGASRVVSDFIQPARVIKADPQKNEVMAVLDRICAAVYAKESLYDEYIAKLK